MFVVKYNVTLVSGSNPSSVPVGRFCPVNTVVQQIPDGLMRSIEALNLP